MTDPLLPKPATALPPVLQARYGLVPPAPRADALETLTVPGLAGDRDPASWRELAKGLDAYVLEAERLDGDLFEVKVSPL